MWSFLPDELWSHILEIGIERSGLSHKDLCSVSISCRRLNRLSSEDPLWNRLLSYHSPFQCLHPSFSSSSKSLYKFRFEREKERRVAARRRVLLRKESQISEHSRRLRDIQTRLVQETAKATRTSQELSNLRRLRQACVALNVWQPEVVRSMQKQMVEQSAVPAECRIHALEMELKLCNQQIAALDKSYKDEKCRFHTAKEELASMNYNPVRERGRGDTEHFRRKKLKIWNS